jgi:hypothetical protein
MLLGGDLGRGQPARAEADMAPELWVNRLDRVMSASVSRKQFVKLAVVGAAALVFPEPRLSVAHQQAPARLTAPSCGVRGYPFDAMELAKPLFLKNQLEYFAVCVEGQPVPGERTEHSDEIVCMSPEFLVCNFKVDIDEIYGPKEISKTETQYDVNGIWDIHIQYGASKMKESYENGKKKCKIDCEVNPDMTAVGFGACSFVLDYNSEAKTHKISDFHSSDDGIEGEGNFPVRVRAKCKNGDKSIDLVEVANFEIYFSKIVPQGGAVKTLRGRDGELTYFTHSKDTTQPDLSSGTFLSNMSKIVLKAGQSSGSLCDCDAGFPVHERLDWEIDVSKARPFPLAPLAPPSP